MTVFDTTFLDQDKGRAWHRYGLTWTDGELDELRWRFQKGFSLEAICKALQRPASGVVSKLVQHGHITRDPCGSYHITASEPQYQPQSIFITAHPQPKEKTMSNDITIVTRTFIGGVDTTQLSDEQIFQLIARKENEVKTWEVISARPKKLQALIDAAKADIQKLVDFVDAR